MPRGGAATSVEATLSRYEFEFARDEFIDKLSFIVDKGIQSGRLLPYIWDMHMTSKPQARSLVCSP